MTLTAAGLASDIEDAWRKAAWEWIESGTEADVERIAEHLGRTVEGELLAEALQRAPHGLSDEEKERLRKRDEALANVVQIASPPVRSRVAEILWHGCSARGLEVARVLAADKNESTARVARKVFTKESEPRAARVLEEASRDDPQAFLKALEASGAAPEAAASDANCEWSRHIVDEDERRFLSSLVERGFASDSPWQKRCALWLMCLRAEGEADENVIRRATEMASSQHAEVRATACRVLRYATEGVHYAEDSVLGREGDSWTRMLTGCSYSQERYPALAAVFEKLLADPSSAVRDAAVESMGHFSPRDAWKLLLPLVDDPDDRVALRAAAGLFSLRWVKGLDDAARILKEGQYPRVRALAAWYLGESRSKARMGILKGALREDESPAVRAAVVRALSKIEEREAVDAIASALVDIEPGVRLTAARACLSMGGRWAYSNYCSDTVDRPPPPETPLRPALDGAMLRRAAGTLLDLLWASAPPGAEELAEAVRRIEDTALYSPSLELPMLKTAHALWRGEHKESSPALAVLLLQEEAHVRKAAAEALAECGDDDALDALALAAMEDPDLGVRGAAADALARAAGDKAARYATWLLVSKDPLARVFGVNCLCGADSDEAAERIVQVLESRDPELAGQAIKLTKAIWGNRYRGKTSLGLSRRSARLSRALAFFLGWKERALVVDDSRNECGGNREGKVPQAFPDGRLQAVSALGHDARECLDELRTPEAWAALAEYARSRMPDIEADREEVKKEGEEEDAASRERILRVQALAREEEFAAGVELELLGYLDDENPRVRQEVLSSLKRLGGFGETIPGLLRLAETRWPRIAKVSRDPDEEVRAELCGLASEIAWRAQLEGGPRGVKVLRVLLRSLPELAHLAQDPEPSVRNPFFWFAGGLARAAENLGLKDAQRVRRQFADTALRELVRCLLEDEDRDEGYWSLVGDLPAEDVLPKLQAALSRADRKARARIITAMCQLEGPAGEEAIIELTRSDDAELAEVAAERLSWWGEKSAARVLEILSNGPDRLRRAVLAKKGSYYESPADIGFVPVLCRLLASPDREVRTRAASILSKRVRDVYWTSADVFSSCSVGPELEDEGPLITEEFVRRKREEASSDDAATRVRALDWWLGICHHSRWQVFRKGVTDPDPRVRLRAAYGLAASLGLKAAPELDKLARTDPDEDVRLTALSAFFALLPSRDSVYYPKTPRSYRERLLELLRGEPFLVRYSALLLAVSVRDWEKWIGEELARLARSDDPHRRRAGLLALSLAPYPPVIGRMYLADKDGPDHEELVYLVSRMPWRGWACSDWFGRSQDAPPMTKPSELRKLARRLFAESVHGERREAARAALDSLQSDPTQMPEDLLYVYVEAALADDEGLAEAAVRRLAPITEAWVRCDIWQAESVSFSPADARELALSLRSEVTRFGDDSEPVHGSSFEDSFREAAKDYYHKHCSPHLVARLRNKSAEIRGKAVQDFFKHPPKGEEAEKLRRAIPRLPREIALALMGYDPSEPKPKRVDHQFLKAGLTHRDESVRKFALFQTAGHKETAFEALELARPLGARMRELVLGRARGIGERSSHALAAATAGDGPLAEEGLSVLRWDSYYRSKSALDLLPAREWKGIPKDSPEAKRVVQAMRSADPQVWKRVWKRYSDLAAAYAWELLSSDDVLDRRRGALTLARNAPDELPKLFHDRDRMIRAYAIVQLADWHAKVPACLEELFGDPDPMIRWLAAWAYDSRNSKGREEFILSALEEAKGEELIVLSCLLVEPGKRARRQSQSGPKAGGLVSPRVAEYLRSALSGKDPRRRRGAVVACGIARFPEAQALLKALSDEDPLIRSTAAWALGRCALFLQRKEARKVVGELKRARGDEKARRSAAWALKRFGVAPDTR